jgi:hypothetical protein
VWEAPLFRTAHFKLSQAIMPFTYVGAGLLPNHDLSDAAAMYQSFGK